MRGRLDVFFPRSPEETYLPFSCIIFFCLLESPCPHIFFPPIDHPSIPWETRRGGIKSDLPHCFQLFFPSCPCLFFRSSLFEDYYLRRSRQVLELCKLLLGLLLLWGGSSLSEYSSRVVYFGFINSLRGGIHLLNQFPFTWLRFYELTSGWDPALLIK